MKKRFEGKPASEVFSTLYRFDRPKTALQRLADLETRYMGHKLDEDTIESIRDQVTRIVVDAGIDLTIYTSPPIDVVPDPCRGGAVSIIMPIHLVAQLEGRSDG